MSLQRTTVIKAVVRPDGSGRLVGAAPITLKNQFGSAGGASNLVDLNDVNVVELVDGSTLIYNMTTEKYDVRTITQDDFGNIDLGEF